MSKGNGLRAAFITALLFSILMDPASAGSMSIAPLGVNFDAKQRSEVVQITNSGSAELAVQVETFSWSQVDGKAAYGPTDEIIAVPPIFSLPPGETQLVRIGIILAPASDYERSFRLFFTELPPPITEREGPGLTMRLRVGIPVFDKPLVVDEAALEIVGVDEVDGNLRVSLFNSGNTHVRVRQLLTLGDDAEQEHKTPGYVLAGSRRDFLVKTPAEFEVGRVQAVADAVEVREYEMVPGE